MTDPLVRVIAEVTERAAADVREEAELEADLGLDSIGRIELLMVIEEELGQAVDEARVGPQTTVAELRRLAAAGGVVAAPSAGGDWPRAWWARVLRMPLLW